MNNLITNNLPGMGSEKTINSQDLLVMVNNARRQCGESSIRNNVFIERIKDELEGETYKIFVGQKNGAEIEIIDMLFKQALRVAARESKAVRRTLVDQLEDMAGNKQPMTEIEMIAAMAADAVRQQKRIAHVEEKVEEVVETIEKIKRGSIPEGWIGFSGLRAKHGMSRLKCKTLINAYGVPADTHEYLTPDGLLTTRDIVAYEPFMRALREVMAEAEQKGTRWYHPKMNLFQVLNWES